MDIKYTVTELTELIRQNLEGSFPFVTVEGELSNCRPSSTGHLYFTLKDSFASISCMMFKNKFSRLSFDPVDGMLLRVKGSLSVYALRGTYSIICEEMERAGEGDILAMLEKLKKRLSEEGLFNIERKRKIPRFPKTVGVVSSPSGAALADILNILGRRAAGITVVVLPAPVQGSEAADIIALRIKQANQWKLADVLIVGRGGGSLEDLLPFSDEKVVRAVADSEIPVVSAVGHEIDWALCDYASDLRAPTPSAAAELVSANREETLSTVRNICGIFYHSVTARLEKAKLSLKPFNANDLEYRFRAILQPYLFRFDDAKENLVLQINNRITDIRHRFDMSSAMLEAGNPLLILERGFSRVTKENDSVSVKRARELKPGDRIMIRPMEGIVIAEVKTVE